LELRSASPTSSIATLRCVVQSYAEARLPEILLAHRTDSSDSSSTAPKPDLNPLVNPILGENMGRWAEVYYTNPPEKRQEAVLELLRELELENRHRENVVPENVIPIRREESPAIEARDEDRDEVHDEDQAANTLQPSSIHCEGCGHENPGDQRFCGMCGVPLAGLTAPDRPSQIMQQKNSDARPANVFPERVFAESISNEQRPPFIPQPRYDDYPRSLSFLRPQEEEEKPLHYRFYLGVALAALILALGYVAWRNAHTNSTTAQLAPQTPPAVAEQQPVQPAQAQPTNAPPKSPPPAPDRTQAKALKPRPASVANQDSVARESALRESALKTQQPAVSATAGAQELAIAENYLNGTNGQQRNSAEAAQWLWKAVEKRNTEATLLLSDLYLKGEGVSKNCDQAHVLLDAAASRGVRDAAVRLRNLRAFGCE
jgi:hypothetical protein